MRKVRVRCAHGEEKLDIFNIYINQISFKYYVVLSDEDEHFQKDNVSLLLRCYAADEFL